MIIFKYDDLILKLMLDCFRILNNQKIKKLRKKL